MMDLKNLENLKESVRKLDSFLESLSDLENINPLFCLEARKNLLFIYLWIIKSPDFKRQKKKRQKADNKINKDRILEFVQKFPQVKPRDIYNEFSSFSERTIQRSVKELVQSGLIKRHSEDKGVYYSVAKI